MTITSPFEKGVMEFSHDAVLRDYRVGVRSRHASVLGRQEVLTGRAKFGIFGDGKEVAQLAMAYAFRRGDVRSGYYRDQTFMMALGLLEVEELFAQLYAHAEIEAEPAFGGRAMTGHFATRMLDERGRLKDQLATYNSSADLSPTAAQMPRLVGLAYASKLYRGIEGLTRSVPGFSENGNEIAFGTIGNASCAEGVFWEAVNAIGVLQVPAIISIWDDGYGISVPNRYQMTKGNVSEVLQGFQRRAGGPGYDVFTVEGWNYPRLCETYLRSAESCRRDHVPVILHVCELTQPLGHSTSGSHERYKSPERLAWERDYDCLRKMREWILEEGTASPDELDAIEEEEKLLVREARDRALEAYRKPIDGEKTELVGLLRELAEAVPSVTEVADALERRGSAIRRDLATSAHRALVETRGAAGPARERLASWRRRLREENRRRYGSDLYSEGEESALRVPRIEPVYGPEPVELNGFEILNACFDAAFSRDPRVIAMGEDVGQLGDVNQGLAHLQQKYGELRVSDTGIREATILGQAIGLAQRGLRPIAEVQYLDYVLYALQILSDDLATLRWRTRGGQKAPVIVRTRGHRLEGIWHSGSPMGGVLHLCRGIYVCVPRDATRAAGFYNTLLRSDDTAIIVEVLNGYRRKETLPSNIDQLTVPLGVPEVLRAGADATVVTYGALCSIALEAADDLAAMGIDAEVIDVQTLLPFDLEGVIVESLRKTNRVLFVDEDVPGGASAYMLRQVLESQGGYEWLDAAPRTLTAAEHRPPYGSDGDYFSKPQRDGIVEAVYGLMRETDPRSFPAIG